MNPLEQKAIESVRAASALLDSKMNLSSAIKLSGIIYDLFREAVTFAAANDAITTEAADRLHKVLISSRDFLDE